MKVKLNCRDCGHRDVCKYREAIDTLINNVEELEPMSIDIYMECKNFIPFVYRRKVEQQESEDEELDMEDDL